MVVTGTSQRIVRGSLQGADCEHCPCARAGQPHRPVVGEGAEDPAWIAVGMEPGQTEILEGRPFCGPSGRVVNDALSKIRVDRDAIYVTNALCCLPQSGSSDSVKRKARECCAPRLQQELLQFPGRPILALGALAAQGFLGDTFSIMQMAGAYHEVDVADWPWKPQDVLAGTRQEVSDAGVITDVRVVIPSLHPAAILRGGAGSASTGAHTSDLAFWALCYDAQKINLIARGVDIRFTDDVQFEAEDSMRAEALVADFLPEARKARLVAVDTETYVDDPKRHSALQSYLAKLSAVGLATRDRAISIAWKALTPRAKRFIAAILADSSITKVMHNAMYDTVVLARHGVPVVGQIEDCYVESETEFLTDAGWKSYDDVAQGAKLATVRRDGTFEWQEPFHRVSKHYVGRALIFETQHTRAVVTGNHRMWCQPVQRSAKVWRGRPVGGWQFVRAEDMLNSESFLVQQTCKCADGSSEAVTAVDADRLRLLGLWISDGSVNAHGDSFYGITISQEERGRASRLLRTLAKRFPFTVSKSTRSDRWRRKPCVEETWRLNDPEIAKQFVSDCGRRSKERRLPKWIWDLSAGYKEVFLSGLFSGDGTAYGGRRDRFTYRSCSGRLADDVQALALSIGWTATAPSTTREDGMRYVYILRAVPFDTQIRARLSGPNSHVREIAIDDRIVCFSVPNETLVTRSRGKPAFYGNTMLLHHNAFPGLAHDLQRVATQFFAITPWKSEHKKNAETDGMEGLLRYNAKDVLSTARLYEPLTAAVHRSNSLDTYNVDMAMAKIAAQMHIDGVPINREVNEQLRVHFKSHIDKSRGEIIARAFAPDIHEKLMERLAFEKARRVRKRDPLDLDLRIAARLDEMKRRPFAFQIGSNDHVVALLKSCGIPLNLQTAKGQITTKKDVLESFIGHPEVRAILDYRENSKLLSTFCERMLDREYAGGKVRYGFADANGRVHPRWSVHKISGRWGSEGPPCQNWPKADKKKGRPNLRSQVIAPQGRLFVGFDMSQLEARIIALLSGDPFLVDIFRSKKDIHSEFARIVWPDFDQKPVDERKVLRDLVKRPEYCSFYGGGLETAWKSVVRDYPNVTIAMMGKMVNAMKTKMPGVTAWHQHMMCVADQEGEVKSALFGRRRCFPLKQFDLSETVNFPVQSTGADIVNRGLMWVMPKLPPRTFPILQIHDAVVFECPEDVAEKLKEIVKETFTQQVTYEGTTIDFPVDAKLGKCWAEV